MRKVEGVWRWAVAPVMAGGMALSGALRAQVAAPTRFTVVDAGTAGKPDVLLLPGLNSGRAVWDGEAALLAPGYRLHLVQVNGFAGQPAGGNAGAGLLPALVEELHGYIAAAKMTPVVIGHSMGGLLGLMLAAKYPGDVQRLVVVDALPAYVKLFGSTVTPESAKPQIAAMRRQMESMPADQYAAMQPMVAARLAKSADGQKRVAAAGAASDRAVSVEAMVEDMQTDVTPQLASVQTPTLVLYPYEAGVQQAAQVDALYHDVYATMPHVRLERIDDSRHFIQFDQPAAMDRAIEASLK